MGTYADVKTQTAEAANGDHSLEDESDGRPLAPLQHFSDNLDSWNPTLIDALAQGRRIVTFDYRGVNATTSWTPHRVRAMAEDAVEFITALGLARIDLLGFSLGSSVA
ncbi:alpha/beta hydrolase fold [Actinacidiphila rubida]|uniref:Alpha/beta hydrolase fold n=1 Tax=Actinacidiphila rubida TaxID=310780 RepID=A0A1H8TSV3_9ACTN|nr:alpha/beta hydrolase fold [Actinacidiphila rubida]